MKLERLDTPALSPDGDALLRAAAEFVEAQYGVIVGPAGAGGMGTFKVTLDTLPARGQDGYGQIVLPVGPVRAITAVRVGGKEIAGGVRLLSGKVVWGTPSIQIEEGKTTGPLLPAPATFDLVEIEKAAAGAEGGEAVEVEFMAGFAAGRVPHLATLAMRQIADYWKATPAAQERGELGPKAGMIEQYLEVHSWHGGGKSNGLLSRLSVGGLP